MSVTPIHLDTTHYDVLEQFRAWEPCRAQNPQAQVTEQARPAWE